MSYSGDPSASQLDEVRFLVGDTSAIEKLTDEEINYLIAQWGSPMRAAHAAAMSLAGLYAGKMDKSIGSTRIAYSQLHQQYLAMAKEIAKRGGFTSLAMSAVPTAGGLVGSYRTPRYPQQVETATPITLDMDVDWRNDQDP